MRRSTVDAIRYALVSALVMTLPASASASADALAGARDAATTSATHAATEAALGLPTRLLVLPFAALRRPKTPPVIDSDGDHIPDLDDACPYAPGLTERRGCPVPDSDGDGILDTDDTCPRLPGILPDGCPEKDVDRDGTLRDPDDRCPDAAETRNGFEDHDGCPDALPADLEAITGILRGVAFDLNKDAIRPRSFAVLDQVVAVMQKYRATRFEISGHIESTGSREYRSDLSSRRADSIMRYLVHHGIDPARLETRGAGPDEPIDTNKTAAGRAHNRRIELQLLLY